MTAIAITGGTGFVGRHAVDRARARGWDVRVAEGDLRDPAVAGRLVGDDAEAVLHLAAPPRSGVASWDALAAELEMARNLIDAAGGRPVVLVGSAAQYGMGSPEPLAETFPTEPLTPYAAVKCVVEQAVTAAPLAGAGRVVWARAFNVIGPGQPASAPVAAWAGQLADGTGVLRTGALDRVRDFLDVRDAADALLDLSMSDEATGVVNVGSGTPSSLRAVVEGLIAAEGREVSFEVDPALLRPTDPPYVVADVARLRALTTFRPAHTLASSLNDILVAARAGTGLRG